MCNGAINCEPMRITVILTDEEYVEAKRRAGLIPLSRWFRSLMNATDRMAPAKPKSVVSSGEAQNVYKEVRQAVHRAARKACIHGVEKGYHCWQCKGLAVIE